ncbi:MAG: ABC transporter permease subunit [Chloroflexi bacterium]|nr:ABC transporter permease subunit [Chloroflexota bacterium]
MRRKKIQWAPYMLLLPSLIYLAVFFAWPMVRALQLSVTGGGAELLTLYEEPGEESEVVALVPIQTEAPIVEIGTVEEELASGRTRDQYWYKLETIDKDGNEVTGWAPFFLLSLDAGRRDSTQARVVAGDTTESALTTSHIERMINDAKFMESIRTTLLLIIVILPLQFILAIVMALLLQSQLRGSTIFLYIYAIPLGVSDLAAGLIWLSIFQQSGYLNTVLEGLGILDDPYIFIQRDNRFTWVLFAVVLAEVWRATSIVMVIIVSGLQAIPSSLVEAGEVFGANLWQRLRYIILPLLMPSIQVALILRTILAFQVFAVLIAIAGSRSVATVMARETFYWYDPVGYGNPNVAAAYSGLIMILSLGIALIYLRTITTQEEKSRRVKT